MEYTSNTRTARNTDYPKDIISQGVDLLLCVFFAEKEFGPFNLIERVGSPAPRFELFGNRSKTPKSVFNSKQKILGGSKGPVVINNEQKKCSKTILNKSDGANSSNYMDERILVSPSIAEHQKNKNIPTLIKPKKKKVEQATPPILASPVPMKLLKKKVLSSQLNNRKNP